jgi:hypothetical protein
MENGCVLVDLGCFLFKKGYVRKISLLKYKNISKYKTAKY